MIQVPKNNRFRKYKKQWIVVLVVEHEEYLGAVDLTSDVVTIPTRLASYFLV